MKKITRPASKARTKAKAPARRQPKRSKAKAKAKATIKPKRQAKAAAPIDKLRQDILAAKESGAIATKVTASSNWQDQLFDLLARPQGATQKDVAHAFNWAIPTARARISTALRERGIQIERTRELRDGVKTSVYRPVPQLQLGEDREALGNRYRKEKPAKATAA